MKEGVLGNNLGNVSSVFTYLLSVCVCVSECRVKASDSRVYNGKR